MKNMIKDAIFSESRIYRYMLSRIWDRSKGMVAFIGLNPSTADETIDDPTVRRCINYADSWGYGGIYMLNIFAFRATDPKVMKAAEKPVGIFNDDYILKYTFQSDLTIAAWGNHGTFQKRDSEVKNLLIDELHCLAKSKGDLKPILFS